MFPAGNVFSEDPDFDTLPRNEPIAGPHRRKGLRLAAVKGLGGRGAQRLRLGKPYVDAPCKERQRGGDVQDQSARKGLGRQQAGLVAECDARTAGARIAGRHAVRTQEGCSGRMGGLHHHPAIAGIGSRQAKVA